MNYVTKVGKLLYLESLLGSSKQNIQKEIHLSFVYMSMVYIWYKYEYGYQFLYIQYNMHIMKYYIIILCQIYSMTPIYDLRKLEWNLQMHFQFQKSDH